MLLSLCHMGLKTCLTKVLSPVELNYWRNFAGGEKIICSCWLLLSFYASCDWSLLVVPKWWSLLSFVHDSAKSNTSILACYIHHHCKWYIYSFYYLFSSDDFCSAVIVLHLVSLLFVTTFFCINIYRLSIIY